MAAESLVEEVALNLEEAAEVTRRINTAGVGIFLGGLAVGAVVGFYFGRRWQREKLRAEAYNESKAEVDKIRDVYQQKAIVAEPKPTVEQIIEERGYSVAAAEEIADVESERLLPAPVPIREELIVEQVVVPDLSKEKDTDWDYPRELESRSPEHPYVIHQDELGETSYEHVTYTYYAADDVLCDADDRPLAHGDIIVGQNNLKWGHGSDDDDVVFVRNDKLELDMEICRSHKSYEEEVLGYDPNETN